MREDFPEPDTPQHTVSLFMGKPTDKFFRFRKLTPLSFTHPVFASEGMVRHFPRIGLSKPFFKCAPVGEIGFLIIFSGLPIPTISPQARPASTDVDQVIGLHDPFWSRSTTTNELPLACVANIR